MPRPVVVVLNRKGGVGKTSTCFHLSGALARMGRRVFLIDAIPRPISPRACWGERQRILPEPETSSCTAMPSSPTPGR